MVVHYALKRLKITRKKTTQYNGTMNYSTFEFWFHYNLLPILGKDTVIVVDNTSFHCKKQLFCYTLKYNCRLLFLSPYYLKLKFY